MATQQGMNQELKQIERNNAQEMEDLIIGGLAGTKQPGRVFLMMQ